MRVAAVGHVEWVEFADVARLPHQGEIINTRRVWSEPAGGAAVAAVQLAKLAGGHGLFYTSMGDDELGHAAKRGLEELGLTMHVAWRDDQPTRRAFTYVDDDGERTITVIGPRLEPNGDDPAPRAERRRPAAVGPAARCRRVLLHGGGRRCGTRRACRGCVDGHRAH